MTIQAVSKVLAQGIGGSIILIIALHIVFNILSSIITGQYEEDVDDERDKIYELYMMVMLYTYQHKSLDYLARKFNVSSSVAKEIIIRSRFGGTCG